MIKLINYTIGDNIELLKTVPDNSIDLILTDPPFNVNIDYGLYEDNMYDIDYSKWFHERLVEMYRVLKEGRVAIIFSGDIKIHPILDSVIDTGFTFHHFLKWYKPGGQRALSGLVLFYRTELALLLSKSKINQKILNRKILYSDTLVYNNTSSNGKDDIFPVDHPCRRPVSLYMNIIKGLTKEGDTVLDPFLGSGTTLLACKLTNRDGIGFEINPGYEQLIKERIGMNMRYTLDSFDNIGEL